MRRGRCACASVPRPSCLAIIIPIRCRFACGCGLRFGRTLPRLGHSSARFAMNFAITSIFIGSRLGIRGIPAAFISGPRRFTIIRGEHRRNNWFGLLCRGGVGGLIGRGRTGVSCQPKESRVMRRLEISSGEVRAPIHSARGACWEHARASPGGKRREQAPALHGRVRRNTAVKIPGCPPHRISGRCRRELWLVLALECSAQEIQGGAGCHYCDSDYQLICVAG